MSELGELLNNDELLRLSLFAKSCNLINSEQLDSIIESNSISNIFNNQNKEPSQIALSKQKKANSKIFEDYQLESFKEYVNEEVLRIFFELLTQDLDFAAIMTQTVYDINGGAISPENLREVILEKISEDINKLAVDIASGKKITLEEIKKRLKGAISSKRKEIAEETNNNAKKTDNDGLSSATVFPKLAFKQKYRGLRWRPIKGSTLSPKALEKLQKTTEKIKTALEKIRGGLRTAKSFVALLEKLESIYSNGLIGIISSIAKIIFSFIRDIGSSGVYMLDMISPYIYYDLAEDTSKDDDAKKAKKMQNNFLNSIKHKKAMSTYSHMNRDIQNSMPGIYEYVKTPEEEEWDKKEQENINFINSFYRPTTYAEFIRTIADSFMDEGDIPNYSLKDLIINDKGVINKKRKKTEGLAQLPVVGNVLNNARPGRPIFGKGSNSTVVIVAFSAPNIFNIVTMTYSSISGFVKMLYFFGKSFKDGNFTNFWEENQPANKRLNRLFGRLTSRKFYNYFKQKPKIVNGKLTTGFPSQDPDFYGIAVRNLFPDFFEYMDELEAYINLFLADFKSSLAKELKELLKNLEELIGDIEDFIDKIDEVLSFFQALSTMGLYTLSFTSNGGNEDIVEKLMTAENFPGVKEGDKMRLIGGMVFCYGMPNPKPGNIDFSGIVKEKMMMMNYEAASAKYEASGNSKDDPGSIDDFANKEGIGTNFSSSLDKIFKKLF